MENIHAVGRRKTSVARVYLTPGKGKITINGRDYKDYFPNIQYQSSVEEALKISDAITSYDTKVNVNGGGQTGQAEATRLGIARALVIADIEHKDILSKSGLLKRDPRMVERKKPGQKKARKNFQFRKR